MYAIRSYYAGNIEGGLSNITEKSLGCIIKGGTTPVVEVIDYGTAPSTHGLVLMDTPGSVTVASAQLAGEPDRPCGFYLRRIHGVSWLRGRNNFV